MIDTPQSDVVILGGGLAGLTLALQLKQTQPEMAITIIERRAVAAQQATHKIGESVVELGSFYLREVLGLAEYLDEHHIRKRGFRFFLPSTDNRDLSDRLEIGSKIHQPFPAHQIDRGALENELVRRVKALGIQILLGAQVRDISWAAKGQIGHTVQYETPDAQHTIRTRWVVDATGRRSFLKRKLKLAKPLDHHVHTVWFRIEETVDINTWSDKLTWQQAFPPDHRRLATNHLMGAGYWLWVIALPDGYTSFGIVVDPSIHAPDQFRNWPAALRWLHEHEPVAARMLAPLEDRMADYRSLKHPAHDTARFYHTDRWGLTGDAGAFLDPLYSPGTDFIALGNSWLTELISRDLEGADIRLPVMMYERAHRSLLQGWSKLYQGMYPLMGKTQLMIFKIIWDWATYWAVPCLMFMNGGYTQPETLKGYSAAPGHLGQRFSRLNASIQAFFKAWGAYDMPACQHTQLNFFDVQSLDRLHKGLHIRHRSDALLSQLEQNLQLLERMAAEMFRMAAGQVHGLAEIPFVDPYHLNLQEAGGTAAGGQALPPDPEMQQDLATAWLSSTPTKARPYVA